MTVALPGERVQTLTALIEDAKSLAEAVDELRETNVVLAVILLASLDAYLEHIREQITRTIGA